MIGIYKITSPNKRVYVGQSNNIDRRFESYKKLRCKGQVVLYRSFITHGVDNHKFEVLEQCEISELNNKERYYQDLYSVVGKNGLNCKLTKSLDSNGEYSEETKTKISLSKKGKKLSKEHIEKLKASRIGKKASSETKEKMSKARIGFKFSEKTKSKMSDIAKKRIISDKEKERFLSINIGRKASESTKKLMSEKRKGKSTTWSLKIILDTSNGVFLIGIKEACEYSGIRYNYLSNMLTGRTKNITNLTYV